MPMIVPRAEIYVKSQSGKNYFIRRFQRCKVVLSRSLPCDVCELVLPKLDNLKLFQENDELIVSLGNDRVGMSTLFRGYVSTLSPKNEPLLGAEDFFKTFKEKRNTKDYNDHTPVDIARDIIEYCGFEPVIPDTWEKKHHFYWMLQTAAEAMEELSHIGWDYFCIPATKKIYFGKPYNLPENMQGKSYIFRFTHNVIESALEYRTASPLLSAIVYVTDSKFRGNSIKVTEGSGEPSKIFNLQMDFDPTSDDSVKGAVDQARKFAKQEIAKSQVSGYRGSFKTFGNPFIRHSQKIKIEDPQKQERSGHYFIDQVVHEFSPESGYKMEITVGGIEGGTGGTGGLVA